MPSPNDNTLTTANNLGILSSVLDIADSFDASDRLAYYRFTLTQNSDLSVAFSGKSLDARLISDINGNGIVDSNDRVSASKKEARYTDNTPGVCRLRLVVQKTPKTLMSKGFSIRQQS